MLFLRQLEPSEGPCLYVLCPFWFLVQTGGEIVFFFYFSVFENWASNLTLVKLAEVCGLVMLRVSPFPSLQPYSLTKSSKFKTFTQKMEQFYGLMDQW